MLWFILILLMGTFVFGLAFPAMILIVGVVGVILCLLLIYKILTGGISYISMEHRLPDDAADEEPEAHERRRIYAEEPPNGFSTARSYSDATNVAASEKDMEDAGEVVELPPTALRKDDESAD